MKHGPLDFLSSMLPGIIDGFMLSRLRKLRESPENVAYHCSYFNDEQRELMEKLQQACTTENTI